MNTVVNKSDLNKARYTKQLVVPALDALSKINTQAMSYDQTAYTRVVEFSDWLYGIVSEADGVIAKAAAQLEIRPEIYIKAAGLRLHRIGADINLEQKTIEQKLQAYQVKCEELRKRGFSSDEIESLVTCPQDEIDGHNNNITGLRIELNNVAAFLDDSPRFDLSLLDDAKLAPFLQILNSQATS